MKSISSLTFAASIFLPNAAAWISSQPSSGGAVGLSTPSSLSVATVGGTSTWFAEGSVSLEKAKAQVLQLGAALDRGQSYNPTSGGYYEETMKIARSKIESLVEMAGERNLPTKLEDMEGEWELVLSTVRRSCHCIYVVRFF